MKQKKIIFYFYNRLLDPLLQGNIFLYINKIAEEKNNPYQIAIITYEDNNYPVSEEKQKEIVKEFATKNIKWYPLNWHAGQSFKSKLIDFINGFLLIGKLRWTLGYNHIVSLASVAGSYGFVAAKIFGLKLYMYQYEPHSEYAIDNGMWRKEGLNYKILKWLEKESALFSTAISSGTRFMEERLKGWKTKAVFFKIPSVVNDSFFKYDRNSRANIRDMLGIALNKTVLIYPGKFGDLYYDVEELLNVFKYIYEKNPNFYFLIITATNSTQIEQVFKKLGIPEISFKILPPIDYSSMKDYLSAADIGIISVAPGPSKKFISNIKVGEYLCCGLPYIINKGISEDDIFADENNIGVSVNNYSENEIINAIPRIEKLLSESKEAIAIRCSKAGVSYRGFSTLFPRFEKALQSLTHD